MDKQYHSLDELIEELSKPESVWRAVRYWPRRHLRWRSWLREPKWAYQRMRRGYSDRDSWSLFYHIAGIIANGCKDLRERQLGHPSTMTWEEWEFTLRQIENGMKLAQEDTGTLENRMLIDSALENFRTHFYDLWD